jgi:hypothetical protein
VPAEQSGPEDQGGSAAEGLARSESAETHLANFLRAASIPPCDHLDVSRTLAKSSSDAPLDFLRSLPARTASRVGRPPTVNG